jgi:hypothetical protein
VQAFWYHGVHVSRPIDAGELHALPGLGVDDVSGVGGEEFVRVGEGGDVYQKEHYECRQERKDYTFDDRIIGY